MVDISYFIISAPNMPCYLNGASLLKDCTALTQAPQSMSSRHRPTQEEGGLAEHRCSVGCSFCPSRL